MWFFLQLLMRQFSYGQAGYLTQTASGDKKRQEVEKWQKMRFAVALIVPLS
jgi:hypothetical protein